MTSDISDCMERGASVGLFWVVLLEAPTLLHHRCPSPESYGDYLTCPHGHYETWERWRRGDAPRNFAALNAIGEYEYEDWPRGRVVLARLSGDYIIYADRKIIAARYIPQVQAAFGLQRSPVRVRTDEHYQSNLTLGRPPARPPR